MNHYYTFDQLQECFQQFSSFYNLKESSQILFFEQFVPALKNYIELGYPISSCFEKVYEGARKETYLFEDFVIKLTAMHELQDEERRKEKSGYDDSCFLEGFVVELPRPIKNIHNVQLHLDYIDCIMFQKRVKILSDKIINNRGENLQLIINKQWLLRFIAKNYNQHDADLIAKFLSHIDYTNHNIAYDNENNPILLDW